MFFHSYCRVLVANVIFQLFFHTDFPLVMNSFSQLIVFLSLQILFMNKIDLFQDKILHSGRHLRLYLPQFKGRIDIH